uniref:DYW domain-containing protein n=1 Tax=Kalanchoe fedtschenkoi TaxID=63787 RepID=A0A7N0UQ06_KALFE
MRLLNPLLQCISETRHLLQTKISHFHSKSQLDHHLRNSTHPDSTAWAHCALFKTGFIHDPYSANHLQNSYIRTAQLSLARNVFDEMREPNLVSWTSLITGYVKAGRPRTGLGVYGMMLRETSIVPNSFTLSIVISACSADADVGNGKRVHGQVEIFGLQKEDVVCCALVDMYVKCNDVGSGRRVFDSMSCRSVVAWAAMISGYGQNGQGHVALNLFREFSWFGSETPNHYMLATVVNACASLGRLVSGKVCHGVAVRCGYDFNVVVANALLDMYAKCGSIRCSEKVFRRIENPSVFSYTSIIVGSAKYGYGLALELFKEMLEKKITPNAVTYVGVLHACSHSGLANEGLRYLTSMRQEHGIVPDSRHQNCVVDMLGRIGRLDEAYELAQSSQANMDQGALLWGTLLSASRLHKRVDIAVEASKWLIASKQQVAAAYVTMSNAYAVTGNWDNAGKLRSQMKHNGVSKEPGCSWVEIKDSVYIFYAGNLSSCPRRDEVLNLLSELETKLKQKGYSISSNNHMLVDIEEETTQEMLGLHSERLALAFAFISIPRGVTIRVMKNLRMCTDCHVVFKMISEVVGRDIVVRDVNRFHHFSNGSCTCGDFW